MHDSVPELASVGLEVTTISDQELALFRGARTHDATAQIRGMARLANAFAKDAEAVLQTLVEVAVELCSADSAGVSIERANGSAENFYQWIAVAGEYSPFLDASLPQYPSACTVCLQRGTAQKFRVDAKFFGILGVEAALVKDGILLPWKVEGVRGTIFVISHSSSEAFDREDLRLMEAFADFAAVGVRQQRQQEVLLEGARALAAAEMAHELAHKINNPLQSMTNLLFLARQEKGIGDEQSLALKLQDDMERLSLLTKHLLELPKQIQDRLHTRELVGAA